MKPASLILTVFLTASEGALAGAATAGTPPEIGMFVLQLPREWRTARDEPEKSGLAPIGPTAVVRNAGVSWVRVPLLNNMKREPETGGWTFPSDPYLKKLRRGGVKIFGTIGFNTLAAGESERKPFEEAPKAEIEARWLEEVKALVGHHRGTVWVWQIGNEFEKSGFSLEVYVRVFESASQAIREIDPGVPIAAAGFSSGDLEKFIESTWPALRQSKTPPDVLDFHFHTYAGQSGLLDEQLTEILEVRDRELPGAWLIVTENSTFTGEDVPYPWEHDRKITQSEAVQAAELVERAAIALSRGVSVSFGTDMDKLRWEDKSVHPFTHNGLVYNPHRTYGAAAEARTWPKRAWWSLRLMTGLLTRDGSHDATHTVRDEPTAPRVDLVTFGSRRPVYLAWSEGATATAVVLEVPGIETEKACITAAVASVDGKDIDPHRWRDAFSSRAVEVAAGQVTVDLSAGPVWISAACP